MYIKNLIILILLLNELINGYELSIKKDKNDELSCNEELDELGCSCYSDINLKLKQEFNSCSYLLRLRCILNKNISYSYYNVTNSLSRFMEVCWSHLYFENANSLTPASLVNLRFSAFNSQKYVYIIFKNVYEIDSYAFELIKFKNNENLIIKLDSSLNTSSISSRNLVLKQNCFANIYKCKSLELVNFYNSKSINLHTSMFKNSTIENLVISYSTFNGFYSDSDTQTDNTLIKNIIIDNSNINILEFNTIGKFYTLEGIEIQNSGLVLIENEALAKCCKYIKYLLLKNNQIKTITNKSFKELYYLLYLNLANNPLETIESGAFDSFRKFLIKLNLESTNLVSLNTSFYDMQLLRELFLSNTNNLKFDDVKIILENAPSLEYLKLDNSGIVKNDKSLNNLINEIDKAVKDNSLTSLNFVDVSTTGVYLNEKDFRDSFEQKRNCLWEKVLTKTFIKVHIDHPCNCALFYLYRNFTKFNFPNTTSDYSNNYELKNLKFNSYFNQKSINNLNDWEFIFSHLPKCYKIIWMQSYSFNAILKQEIECGLWDNEVNCSDVRTTTILPTTDTTTEESTSTSNIITQSTTEIKYTTPNEDTTMYNQVTDTTEILTLKKKIVSKYTIPILLSVFALCLFILMIIGIKAKYDYKNTFLGIYNKTLTDSSKRSRELDNIAIISSSVNNTIEPFIFDIDDTSSLINN